MSFLLAAVFLVSACDPTGQSGSSGTPAAPAPAPAPGRAGAPRVDPGGPERPLPPVDPVSFKAARLPIGKAGVDEACVRVSYLGGNTDIPPGVRLEITGATFDPAAYEVGGDGCYDYSEQPCLGTGFAFTAENTGEDYGTCAVPLRPVGFSEKVRLTMTGTIVCADGRGDECARFAEDLRKKDKGITFNGPDEPTDPSTTPPPGDGS